MVVVGRKWYRTVRAGRSARLGVATAGRAGHGLRARGRVVTRLADDRGTPPGMKPLSTVGGALPAAVAERRRIRVEMRSEKGVIVYGAGDPGEVMTGPVGPVDSTGLVPCTELREGVGWAIDVVAVGASAESPLATVGTAKP